MPNLVRGVALTCGGVMALLSRLTDSADDRRDRLRQSELHRLWQQSQELDAKACR